MIFASDDRVADLNDRCIGMELRIAELNEILAIQEEKIAKIEGILRRYHEF